MSLEEEIKNNPILKNKFTHQDFDNILDRNVKKINSQAENVFKKFLFDLNDPDFFLIILDKKIFYQFKLNVEKIDFFTSSLLYLVRQKFPEELFYSDIDGGFDNVYFLKIWKKL